MCLIFSFSARTADVSTNDSHMIGRKIGQIFLPGFEKQSEKEQERFAKKIDHPIRKSAHFIEYAILGIFLSGTLAGSMKNRQTELVVSWMTGTIYAASDEFHQLFVAGRSGQILDVMLDSTGVLAGVFLAVILTALLRKKKRG